MLSAASLGRVRLLTRQTGAAVAGSRWEFSGSGAASSAPIQTVTVVGSGLMGSGIAQVCTSDCTAIKDYHGLGLYHLKVTLNFS